MVFVVVVPDQRAPKVELGGISLVRCECLKLLAVLTGYFVQGVDAGDYRAVLFPLGGGVPVDGVKVGYWGG